MSFEVIEEWEDADNPYKYYRRSRAGPFATRQEADEAKKLLKPLHHIGTIRVKEVVQQGKATPKKRRPSVRAGRRNGRR